MESEFGAMPPARFARRNQIGLGSWVARETRLPQAILSHAFSVKMRARRLRSQRYARAMGVKMRTRRPRSRYEVVALQKTKTDVEAIDWKVCPTQREDAGETPAIPGMKLSRSGK